MATNYPKVTTPKPVATAQVPKPTVQSAPQQATVQNYQQTHANGAPATSLSQVQQLGRQYGMDDQMLGWIAEKAGQNIAMDSMTPEKQAVYDAYQNYMVGEIGNKAVNNQALSDPTQWKMDIYNANRPAQTPNAVQMPDFQGQSDAKLASMQEWLQQSANGQIQQQEAQLQAARDAELAALQKALNDAVSQGELSLNQAQAQFESAREGIQRQGYQDAEYTQLMSQQRGIANSMQSLGLMQGDQARSNSLLNQNLTTRDQQMNAINNQLDNIRNSTNIDMVQANSNFDYALANATGGINANMANQMTDMTWQDYQTMQQFQMQNYMQDKDYAWGREQTATGQANQLAQMSQQQQYQLQQMATQQGYDLSKMSVQQQYQLAQMMQGFGYDMALQGSNQQFQGQQNALDRNQQLTLETRRQQHDYNMLSAEQQAQLDMYDVELQRKLALYTPGSAEHKLLNAEADWAYGQAQKENLANMTAEIGHTQLAGLLAMYPTTLPDQSDASAVEAYNKQVESVNKQIERIINDPSSQQYLRDLEKANGTSTSSGKSVTDRIRDFLKAANPIGIVPRTIYNAVKNSTP